MFATKYKEDALRQSLDDKLRRLKAKKSYIKDDYYWHPNQAEYQYYNDIREEEYYYKEEIKQRYLSPEEEKRLAEEAKKAQEEYDLRLKLQNRVIKAEWKNCSECESYMPHDVMDYLCIGCRDGEEALFERYMDYAPSRPTPEPKPF